jgi:hypothetical protein
MGLNRYKLLLGVSPNLEDLADEFPDDYEQLTMIGRLSDSEQDRVLGSLLEDPDLQRHFTTASKLQKLRESIDVAAEIDQSFIPIRDLFKEKHPAMSVGLQSSRAAPFNLFRVDVLQVRGRRRKRHGRHAFSSHTPVQRRHRFSRKLF